MPLTELFKFQFLNEKVVSFYEKHGCDDLVADEKNNRNDNRKPFSVHRFQPELYLADLTKPEKFTVYKQTDGEFDDKRTIPVESPRKNCIFSSGKAYLFDDINDASKSVSHSLN